MALLLGIDLGTSYFKVGLFDAAGTLKGLGRVAVEKQHPAPGRVELPPERFWTLLRQALHAALAQAGASPREIAGMSYSSQANTFVLMDHFDRAVTPLVFWTDVRGAVPETFATFSESERFRRTIGFGGITAESAVTKWHWFREHEPALWSQAGRLMTLSDFVTMALTGEPVGDASTAALLGLYDLVGKRWWADALATFEVNPTMLSVPLMPGTPAGRTVRRASVLLDIPAGIPFAVGGLDHHVAAVGSGLGAFADISISTGTVLAATRLVDEVSPLPGCFHGPHVDGKQFYRLAFDPAGAGQLERFQREFAPGRTIEELIGAAAALPPGSRPAAPRWTPAWAADASRATRDLLESIARGHEVLIATVSRGRPVRRIAATGGGARSAPWLGIKADIIGAPIVTPGCAELACLGAATFAAAAAGVHGTIADAVRAMVREAGSVSPDAARHAAYRATAEGWAGRAL